MVSQLELGLAPGRFHSVAFLPDLHRQPSSKLFFFSMHRDPAGATNNLLQAGWQGHLSGPREDTQFSSHTDMQTEPQEQSDFPGPTGDEEQG